MGHLDGRVAVITGAGTGIGVGVAKRLARDGARVVVSASNSLEGANRVAAEITAEGGAAKVVSADFRTASNAREVVRAALDSFGGIDILVNNAGSTLDKPFLDTTEEDWTSVFNINAFAMFVTCHAALPHMIEQGYGRIINISSVHGMLHAHGHTIYGATKGAVNEFTRALAIEVAPHGITANVVAPGTIYVERYDRTGRDLEGIAAQIPTRTLGTPDDVAGAVAYLASEEARYVCGEIFYIDGGLTAKMSLE